MTTTAGTEALIALDRSIDDLATSGDMDALGRLLADEFVYVHSTDKVEPKGEWIEGLSRLIGQRDRIATPVKAEVHGSLGIVLGDLDIRWKTDRDDAFNRYVRVYRLVDGDWRAISQRTVKAPDRTP